MINHNFISFSAVQIDDLSDIHLHDACNMTGQIGQLGSQWKMSKNNHYPVKCLFAKDFMINFFSFQDHTIYFPEKFNIIFIYIENSKKLYLGILKIYIFFQHACFSYFIIGLIVIGFHVVQFRGNRARNFKSVSRYALSWFEINRLVTPEIVLHSVL